MELVKSTKGKDMIIYNDYRFRKDKSAPNKIYWRCINKNCKSRLTTGLDYNQISQNGIEHNHPPSPNEGIIIDTMNKIKKRCLDENSSIPSIYREEVSFLSTNTDTVTSKTVTMFKNLSLNGYISILKQPKC